MKHKKLTIEIRPRPLILAIEKIQQTLKISDVALAGKRRRLWRRTKDLAKAQHDGAAATQPLPITGAAIVDLVEALATAVAKQGKRQHEAPSFLGLRDFLDNPKAPKSARAIRGFWETVSFDPAPVAWLQYRWALDIARKRDFKGATSSEKAIALLLCNHVFQTKEKLLARASEIEPSSVDDAIERVSKRRRKPHDGENYLPSQIEYLEQALSEYARIHFKHQQAEIPAAKMSSDLRHRPRGKGIPNSEGTPLPTLSDRVRAEKKAAKGKSITPRK